MNEDSNAAPSDEALNALRAALERLTRAARIADELPRSELTSIPGVTPLQAQLLANRGARGPLAVRDLLDTDWRATGPLPGQDEAVQRLARAIAVGESIVVYGDHDCDGITSCALFTQALHRS